MLRKQPLNGSAIWVGDNADPSVLGPFNPDSRYMAPCHPTRSAVEVNKETKEVLVAHGIHERRSSDIRGRSKA